MDDDADLVARVRRGDRQAFDDLYDLYADDVFSMCLLILGDPTVARAAAGTAFALVARTRLNPLSDPTRLRSWLLELARGSALAWSGSPQARSIPVPHGVPPEDLLDGAVVPAPASLRVGLARTFDRAAVAAVAATTAATRRAAAKAAEQSASTIADQAASAISLVKTPPSEDLLSHDGDNNGDKEETILAATHSARVLPLIRMDADPADSDADSTGSGAITSDWRNRPAIAVAAAIAVAVAGLTAVVSWPTSESQLMSDSGRSVAVVTPASTAEAVRPSTPATAPTDRSAHSPTIVPTVAGAFTSRAAAPRAVEPVVRDVDKAGHARNENHHSAPATTPAPPTPRTPRTPQSPQTPPQNPPSSTVPAPTTSTANPPTTPPTQQTSAPPEEPATSPPDSPPVTTPPDGNAPSNTPTAPPASQTGGPTVTPESSDSESSDSAPPSTTEEDEIIGPLPVPVFVEV